MLAHSSMLLTSCIDTSAPTRSASIVDKLRILAVSAYPPQRIDGPSVQLRVLLGRPQIESFGSAHVIWVVCEVLTESDSEQCLHAIEIGNVRSLLSGKAAATVYVDLLDRNYTYRSPAGSMASLLIGVIALELEEGAALVDVDMSRVKSYDIAIKRVGVAQGVSPPNSRPEIVDMSLNGAISLDQIPLLVRGNETFHLAAIGNFSDKTQLNVSWYANSGRFPQAGTSFFTNRIDDSVEWLAPVPNIGPPGVTIWAVATNEFGGVSWIERQVFVHP